MKQITVRLIDGKEYTFKVTDTDENILSSSSETSYTADDGIRYIFARDQISTQIIRPMVKCQRCGEFVSPEKRKVMIDDRSTIISVCPYCNYGVGNA